MAKQLKDILNGVKASKKMSGTLGKDPGVDYMPKAGDEAKFAGKHEIEKHEDRVGNKDDVYNGTDVKPKSNKEANKGHNKGEDQKVYEATIKSEAKCNMTEAGTMCPVHGMNECSSMKPIKEDEKDVPFKGPYDKKQDQKAMDKNVAKNAARKAMKTMTKEEVEQVDEVLTKSTTAGETIHDFVHSKNPKFAGKSKEERKRMALGAYYAKQNEDYNTQYHVTENLAVPLLGATGSHDIAKHKTDDTQDEIDMVRTELKAIANKVMHLLANMPRDHHIEPWVQSKIAMAKEMIGGVHDYMMYSDKPEEDEQTDTPYTPPSNPTNSLPDFSADVNTGQNV